MRVLVAPNAVRPDQPAEADQPGLSAAMVAAALAQGWAQARPDDVLTILPLSTGAEGLLEVVRAARGGELEVVVAPAGLGQSVPSTWLHVGSTGYLDVVGLLRQPSDVRAVELALAGSSAGVGSMIVAAIRAGVTRVVIGLGQVAVHDGGLGALRTLAAGLGDANGDRDVADLPLAEVVARARDVVRGVDLLVATATDLPLLGLNGAGAATAGRPGIDRALAQQVEQRIAGDVRAVEDTYANLNVSRPSLNLTQISTAQAPAAAPPRLSRQPGSGAGGGVAFALACLGGRILPGAEVVAVEAGLHEAILATDLILTATTILDGEALSTGVPGAVGKSAISRMLPVVALGDQVLVSRRELSGTGVEAVYPLIDPAPPGSTAPRIGLHEALSQRASRVAKTWSR